MREGKRGGGIERARKRDRGNQARANKKKRSRTEVTEKREKVEGVGWSCHTDLD